jgi:hypothetical protein
VLCAGGRDSFGGETSVAFTEPVAQELMPVGTVVTLVAALLPALRASRIPPVAAMRDAATPEKPFTVLTIAGATPTVVGVAAVGTALLHDLGDYRLWTLLGGVLLVFVGVAILTPAISRPVVSVLGGRSRGRFPAARPAQLGLQPPAHRAKGEQESAQHDRDADQSLEIVAGAMTVCRSVSVSRNA